MLKVKLFKRFALVVVLFGALSALLGIHFIQQRVVGEAQTRVGLDLSSAWSIYNSRLHEIGVILRLAASKEAVVSLCESRNWNDPDVGGRLERIRTSFGLDFLDVIAPDGRVVIRTAPPQTTGDFKVSDQAVASALRGEAQVCMQLLCRSELEREADGLAERAFLELEDTPRARRSEKKVETRGMVMVGAVPVQPGAQVLGVIYGGVLVNRNHELVDRIRDTVFKNELYHGVPMGTATIFLDDSRIATTVRLPNGNRALGTRASKQVADAVLDNGQSYLGEAFVVKDRYLTAYDPIRDGAGRIIGMLYVGMLKEPYGVMGRGIMLRYGLLSLFVLLVALVMAFIHAGRLAQPIHRLVEVSNRMSDGHRPEPVVEDGTCHETDRLIGAFNQMTAALAEREEKLKALNRSYMETLGFVSHELKSPVATIMNYAYLLKEQKLGPLNEKQQKAVRAVDAGSTRLVEMVRHYLNLARIENGELEPVRTAVAVREEILQPLIEVAEAELQAKGMRLTNGVGADIALSADLNMVREVFENLLSNAMKYGRPGGCIEIEAKPDGEHVEFVVRNEGEGVPADRLPELFQKFSRIGNGEARRQKGTGLGLFITRSIVEAHGGQIRAASRAGEWAEFTFTLPRYREQT